MLKLYGIGVSNYYNTAKLALTEKGIPFEEVSIMPGEDPQVLAASPMGKVPYLVRPDGSCLSETNVMFDYFEEIQPDPAMYPQDPWDRAKVKELIRTVELYLDAAARPLLPTIYFGAPRDEALAKSCRPSIEKGLRAFLQLAKFDPYVAGSDYSYADMACFFHLNFVNLHTKGIYRWDVLESEPALAQYMETLAKQPKLDALGRAMQADLDAFLPS